MFSLWIEKIILPLHPQIKRRAFSSAGLEHLPYKQRVGGSNPSTPTFKSLHSYRMQGLYFQTLLVKSGAGVTIYINIKVSCTRESRRDDVRDMLFRYFICLRMSCFAQNV